MTSNAASVSSPASTPPTSKPSTTRSSAPSPSNPSTEKLTKATTIRLPDVQPAAPTLIEQLTPLASPVVALFAIWAVHNLTKGRDREKAVFDLYKTVSDAVAALKPIVIKAWGDEDKEVRSTSVAETNWRLQQIGGYVERIRRQSRRWGWRGIKSPRPLKGAPYAGPFDDTLLIAAAKMRARLSVYRRTAWMWTKHVVWIPGWSIEIGLTRAMAELRDAITADPFGDPDREADKSKSAEVELVIGGFLQDMDLALFTWMDKGSQT